MMRTGAIGPLLICAALNVAPVSRQRADSAPLQATRAPAHRAFWFGWFAQHPDTTLMR
jgi:hypothetical protein